MNDFKLWKISTGLQYIGLDLNVSSATRHIQAKIFILILLLLLLQRITMNLNQHELSYSGMGILVFFCNFIWIHLKLVFSLLHLCSWHCNCNCCVFTCTRSPLVSFLYERGWRQNFNRSGFPGPDEEVNLLGLLICYELLVRFWKTKHQSECCGTFWCYAIYAVQHGSGVFWTRSRGSCCGC